MPGGGFGLTVGVCVAVLCACAGLASKVAQAASGAPLGLPVAPANGDPLFGVRFFVEPENARSRSHSRAGSTAARRLRPQRRLAGHDANASRVQYCAQIPIVGGIPPWGFHTGAPITAPTGSYARGHGDIDVAADTVSGILCQVDRVRRRPDRLIIMTINHHLVYHSHHAVIWGVPGNIMKIIVRVRSSTDPRCKVGTLGRVTLFASYNGVRSDSVEFIFRAACKGHDHLYHGPQVNNQVPAR
jgi:hypothetical protein